MMRAFCLGVMLAGQTAQAQDVQVDQTIVAACFGSAEAAGLSPVCIGEAAEVCMDVTEGGFSTAGMAQCMAAETAVWDDYLNSVYADLRDQMRQADAQDFAGDVSRTDALRDAQRAWIAFRDAECGFNWAMFQEGTIRSLVGAGCFQDMTARRVLELRRYVALPQ